MSPTWWISTAPTIWPGWNLTPGIPFILFAILYSVVTTVLPYLFYTTGLQYVENGAASVIASIEPVVATVLGFLVFSETPTLSTALGIVQVLLALALLNCNRANRRNKKSFCFR